METPAPVTTTAETTNGATPPVVAKTETPFDPKTYKDKVVVDGKEYEVTLDDLKAGYQLRKKSDEKMMSATAMERRATEALKALKDNPKALLKAKELGFTPEQIRKLGEELVAEAMDEDLMTPEQKELRDLKIWKEEQLQERQRADKEKADQEFLTQKKKYADEYTKEIMEVVEKSTLPKTPYMVSRVARLMAASLDSEKPITAQEAVPLVKEDYKADLSHFLKDLAPAQIIEFLGEDVGKKIRDYDLAKLKTPQDVMKKPEKQAEVEDDERPRKQGKRITSSEWRKKYS